MASYEPQVSVVIPTLHRPQLVLRAVRSVSALAQNFHAIEVVVVVEGDDPSTLETLKAIADPECGSLHWLRMSGVRKRATVEPDSSRIREAHVCGDQRPSSQPRISSERTGPGHIDDLLPGRSFIFAHRDPVDAPARVRF
jgi:hypothetical protein